MEPSVVLLVWNRISALPCVNMPQGSPRGGDTLWLLVQLCLLPQLYPFLKWEPHPSSYFLSQLLPGKLPPCSFSLPESRLGPLVCAFLERVMVTVALGFRLFNSLFLSFQYVACMRKAGAMDPFMLLFVIWFSLLQSGSTKQPLLPIRCIH